MAAATIIQFWNATPKSENRSASQLPIQAPGKKLFRGTIIVRADAGLTTLHLFQRGKDFTKHPLSFTLVAVTLWLLATVIIDALTPKWPTVYMIGFALAASCW
jgi:hypothetical protein